MIEFITGLELTILFNILFIQYYKDLDFNIYHKYVKKIERSDVYDIFKPDKHIVSMIINNNTKILKNIYSSEDARYAENLLYLACVRNNTALIRLLINSIGWCSMEILNYNINKNKVKYIKLLLLKYRNIYIDYSLYRAINFFNLPICKFCLNLIDYMIVNLMNIHTDKQLDILKFLHFKNINLLKDNYKLFLVSCRLDLFQLIKFFLKIGADINCKKSEALRLACRNGYVKIIKYLVSKKLNITPQVLKYGENFRDILFI